MQAGDFYFHERFYRDAETGELKPKYLVLLAPGPGGDWVTRLLTSRASMRSEKPRCDHGDPYPGYYLGVPGGSLTRKTWVDLRAMPDLDAGSIVALEAKGTMRTSFRLTPKVLIEVLDCAAGAPDTTAQQERALRDQIALIR